MKYFVIVPLLLSLSSALKANDSKLPEFFQRTKTTIKDPFEMRDPFKRKAQKLKSSSSRDYGFDRTVFSNLPSLEGVPLDKIKIIGVILGSDRRAIAKMGAENSLETFIVKEGMKLGLNKAEVKAILPGGIVLVEKIKNVYDQEEYIETIMPVTVE